MVLGLAALYGVALALIAFWPTHVDQDIDLFDYAPVRWLVSDVGMLPVVAEATIEKVANVLLFVPLGAFAMMIWPSLSRRSTTWSGFALTVFIEVGQAVARPGRTASVSDILTNTLGAYIGASLIVMARNQSFRTISSDAPVSDVTNVQLSSLSHSESGDLGMRRTHD